MSTSSLLAVLDAGDAQPQSVALRSRSYELLGYCADHADSTDHADHTDHTDSTDRADHTVVDVGCGGGRAVAELADRGARALGVDPDPVMIAAARDRWPAAEFRLGGAYDLPLETGSAAGYRADKVLHLLDDPPRALAEARRVLAPGGRAVLLGSDWDTIVIDSDDPAATRRLVHAKADTFPSPRVARRHRALLLDAGFTNVVVEVHTLLLTGDLALALLRRLTDDEGWLAEQADRARRDRIFVALPMFVAAGEA
ncbi:methyltransferase domain-containing protein [Catenulispora yoronensis]